MTRPCVPGSSRRRARTTGGKRALVRHARRQVRHTRYQRVPHGRSVW
jgi:hypothetical protein